MRSIQVSSYRLIPLCMARWRALIAQRPLRAALELGACLGLLGVLCSIVLSYVTVSLLPPELWGRSGAAHLDGLDPLMTFFMMVVFAPLFETVLGQLLPMEAARRLRAGAGPQVLLSGLVFGYGHYASGGIAHGITACFAGLVFAYAYANLRPAGMGPAYLAAASAHAMQNGIMWACMMLSIGIF